MKKKILVSAAVLALLAAPVISVQAAGVLRSIGEHPVSSPLATVEALKDMMRQRSSDIQAGMRAAGHADLFPLVRDHIARYPQTQINVVEYQPGQHIEWMLFRSNGRGRVKVAQNITWGGNAPLTVFEFFIDRNGQRYTFAVPLACGNLSLKETGPQPCEPVIKEVVREVKVPGPTVYVPKEVVKEVKVPVPGPTVYVPKEVVKYVDRPVVKEVKVPVPGPTQYIEKPVIKYVDRPVNVPGPTVYVPKEVVKYVDRPVVKEVVKEVQVPGPTQYIEKPVVKYVDRPVVKEVVKEVQVPGPTQYIEKPVIKYKYVDKPVIQEVEVQGPTRTVYVDRPVVQKEVVRVKEPQPAASCCSDFHFIADASYLNQKEDADYGMGRLGVAYDLNQQYSFMALLGGAGKADGDAGEDALVMDFLLQYNFFLCSRRGAVQSPFFMAAGIGAWMTSGDDDVASEDSGADLIAELGVRISGTPGTANMALFVEGRSATDELDELEDYGRFGGGLRFRF
ncbi:hypothetical protein GCAAIG_13800 [Candidatus Electronema halotolerans]